jgi:hypothetical protein
MEVEKRKIAILNIGFVLNRIDKEPPFAIPKWDYTSKSVEKWLGKTRKYKAVVGGAILNHSYILKVS